VKGLTLNLKRREEKRKKNGGKHQTRGVSGPRTTPSNFFCSLDIFFVTWCVELLLSL